MLPGKRVTLLSPVLLFFVLAEAFTFDMGLTVSSHPLA